MAMSSWEEGDKNPGTHPGPGHNSFDDCRWLLLR